jgi:acetyl esterase/lipase
LRFGVTRLHTTVCWPEREAAVLALVLADELALDDPLLGDSLVVALGGQRPRSEELDTLEWLAEHAADLGGPADRVTVAGGARAAGLAIAARNAGWPKLHRQLLVRPHFCAARPTASVLAGVAPATIVHGGDPSEDGARYAEELRHAGVDVEEILR